MPVDVRKRPTRLVSSASAIWSWQFRIILVGDSTVGKSALLKVYYQQLLPYYPFFAAFYRRIICRD